MIRSDGELVTLVLGGDKGSFEVLVRRYERVVRAVGLGVLGNYHEADDAGQEAFIKAYEKLVSLRKRELFGGWLMRIARRCALDAAKLRAKEDSLKSAEIAADHRDNGKLAADKQWLMRAVMKLPESEKQVVMLRYFGRNAVKDVAAMSSRSVGTVTKQLSRAHKRLRNILRESGS